MKYQTLASALKCKSHGVFQNENGEHITVSYSYSGTTKVYQIVFAKLFEVARRGAIKSTSDKKVLAVINDGNYVNIS